MKFFDKFTEIWNKFTIGISKQKKVLILSSVLLFGAAGGITACAVDHEDVIDPELKSKQNAFLYEEVVFANEIYLKCVGINANLIDATYELNLTVRIEQWNTDGYINKKEITSEMFSLKQVNLSAPTNMEVFFKSLLTTTIEAAIGAIGGKINVLESTLGFASDYISGSVEAATSRRGKTIKAEKDQFEPFFPYKRNGKSRDVKLKFEIPKEIYGSNYTLVLSIDSWKNIEKNIFLILRPNTKSYNIDFDLCGGTGSVPAEPIHCEPAEIPKIPDFIPVKENYKFLCWTREKDKIETKIKDFYFNSDQENQTVTAYAYYQPVLDLDSVVNIGENIYFKDGVYEISINSIEYVDSYIVKTKKGEELNQFPSTDNKLF